jgi:TonB family protein
MYFSMQNFKISISTFYHQTNFKFSTKALYQHSKIYYLQFFLISIILFFLGCKSEENKSMKADSISKYNLDTTKEELFEIEATLSLPEAPQEDDIPTIDTVFIKNGIVNIYPLENLHFKDAQFEGGTKNFRRILEKELIYPKKAVKTNIEGMIFLQFEVNQEGKIENIKIIKDLGYETGEANVKALEKVAQNYTWKPAKNAQGQAVRVKKVIPIKFKL